MTVENKQTKDNVLADQINKRLLYLKFKVEVQNEPK